MRLQQYITEGMTDQEVVKALQKECSQYLKEVREQRLHRGTNTLVRDYAIITPRIGRIPRDTPVEVHKHFDKAFQQKFGWKVRSEGVFVSGDPDVAEGFGKYDYIFYPANGYKFVWSTLINDLTYYLSENGPDPDARFTNGQTLVKNEGGYKLGDAFGDEDIKAKITKNVMETYTDKGLSRAIGSGNEIAFKCSYYYLIDGNFFTKYYDQIYRGADFE